MTRSNHQQQLIGAARSRAYTTRPGVKKAYEERSKKAKKREKAAKRRRAVQLERALAVEAESEDVAVASGSEVANAVSEPDVEDDDEVGLEHVDKELRQEERRQEVREIREARLVLEAKARWEARAIREARWPTLEHADSDPDEWRHRPAPLFDLRNISEDDFAKYFFDPDFHRILPFERDKWQSSSSAYIRFQTGVWVPWLGRRIQETVGQDDIKELTAMFSSSDPFRRSKAERVFNITELCGLILDELDAPELLRMRAVNRDLAKTIRGSKKYGERLFLTASTVQRSWILDLEDSRLEQTCCFTDPAPYMWPGCPIRVMLPRRLNPVIFERPPRTPYFHRDNWGPECGGGRCAPCETGNSWPRWRTDLRLRQVPSEFSTLIDDMQITQPPTPSAVFRFTILAFGGTAIKTYTKILDNVSGLRYRDLRIYLNDEGIPDPSVLLHVCFAPNDEVNVTFPPDDLREAVEQQPKYCPACLWYDDYLGQELPSIDELGDSIRDLDVDVEMADGDEEENLMALVVWGDARSGE